MKKSVVRKHKKRARDPSSDDESEEVVSMEEEDNNKDKEKEAENRPVKRGRWSSFAKGEKLRISKGSPTIPTTELGDPVRSADMFFIAPVGGRNHQSVQFFLEAPEGTSDWEGRIDGYRFRYAFNEKKKLQFPASRFIDPAPSTARRTEPNWTVPIPLFPESMKEDEMIIARMKELSEVCVAWLASEDASPAWKMIGISQPGADVIAKVFNGPVKTWKSKDKLDSTVHYDLRLRFQQTHAGLPRYELMDMRKGENSPVSPDVIEPGHSLTVRG